MPAFQFIGDPRKNDPVFCARWQIDHGNKDFDANDPKNIVMFRTHTDEGLKFELDGEPVDVPEGPRADKLRGNRHFVEVDSGKSSGSGDSSKRGPGRPRKTASEESVG